ncbi:hypothetical protein BC829DRAFT_422396 [Chytridium lagenaria]|nr:hypothetical protein BC829DRAFT_422396 [Chytridium lagenaria]
MYLQGASQGSVDKFSDRVPYLENAIKNINLTAIFNRLVPSPLAINTTGASGNRGERLPFNSTFTNLSLRSENSYLPHQLSTLGRDLTTSADTVSATLSAQQTLVSTLKLVPSTLPSSLSPCSGNVGQLALRGLNGFRTSPRIVSLDLIAGNPNELTFNLTLALTNPSTVSMNYGDLQFYFNYTFAGASVNLGRALSPLSPSPVVLKPNSPPPPSPTNPPFGQSNPFGTALAWTEMRGNVTWTDNGVAYQLGGFDTGSAAGNFSTAAVPGLGGTGATDVVATLSLTGVNGPFFVKYALEATRAGTAPVRFSTNAIVAIGSGGIAGGNAGFTANLVYAQDAHFIGRRNRLYLFFLEFWGLDDAWCKALKVTLFMIKKPSTQHDGFS